MNARFLAKVSLLLFVSILSTGTSSCSPPKVVTGVPTIFPTRAVPGQTVSIGTNIVNIGTRSTDYTVNLKVNDALVETKQVTLTASENKTFNFQYTPLTLGKYRADINGQTAEFEVVKPAHFVVGPISIVPESPETNKELKASVAVTNDGDLPDTYVAVLKVNEKGVNSQVLLVEPGKTVTFDAVYTPNTSGTYAIEYCGIKKDIQVKAPYIPPPTPTIVPPSTKLMIYTDKYFYYKISYPPNFVTSEVDKYTTLISGSTGGIAILTDRLTTNSTAKDYFDAISTGKKKQLPTWTSTSVMEIKEGDVTIGYKYDYSNVVDGTNWIGTGMVFKKGGFGFYVVYTTPEENWEANKETAIRCLDTFVLPKIAIGSYSNPSLDVSLQLPTGWSLIETASAYPSYHPLDFYPPFNQQPIEGYLNVMTIAAGTTAQEYLIKTANPSSSASQNSFTFANSVMGYEVISSSEAIGISGSSLISLGTYKTRHIAFVSGVRVLYFRFEGPATNMDAQGNAISQLAKSLVVSGS